MRHAKVRGHAPLEVADGLANHFLPMLTKKFISDDGSPGGALKGRDISKRIESVAVGEVGGVVRDGIVVHETMIGACDKSAT